jgi:signal transduction histidine kinase
VKQMIEAHRGAVAVESEVGKGTTVVLRLPVPADNVAGSQPLPRPSKNPSS